MSTFFPLIWRALFYYFLFVFIKNTKAYVFQKKKKKKEHICEILFSRKLTCKCHNIDLTPQARGRKIMGLKKNHFFLCKSKKNIYIY